MRSAWAVVSIVVASVMGSSHADAQEAPSSLELVVVDPYGEPAQELPPPERRPDPTAPYRTRRRLPPGYVRLTGHVDAGAGARWLFGDGLVGAALTFGIGLRFGEHVHVYQDVRLFFGEVRGLFFHQYESGPGVMVEIADRVLVGASLTFGGTTLERVTTGSAFTAFSVGLHPQAAYDVVRLEHARFGLVLDVGIDTAGKLFADDSRQRGVNATVVGGPTLAIGARF